MHFYQWPCPRGGGKGPASTPAPLSEYGTPVPSKVPELSQMPPPLSPPVFWAPEAPEVADGASTLELLWVGIPVESQLSLFGDPGKSGPLYEPRLWPDEHAVTLVFARPVRRESHLRLCFRTAKSSKVSRVSNPLIKTMLQQRQLKIQ